LQQLLIDKNILLSVSQENADAFKLLYKVLHQKVYSFAYHLTHHEEMAEDITQDVFVKVWNNRHELNSIDNFEAWLTVVVRNTSYNALKRMAAENLILKKIHNKQKDSTENVEEIMDGKELESLILKAIEKLPPQQKKVFLLSRIQGLKHNEIAQKLDISVFTVKNHIKSALRFLKSTVHSTVFLNIF
jgi:RNA polymerase sigma-70 factor (ECF subfamily)